MCCSLGLSGAGNRVAENRLGTKCFNCSLFEWTDHPDPQTWVISKSLRKRNREATNCKCLHVFRSLIFRKRDSWYALIVRQGRQAELVPFDIFDFPLYTKILHVALALPDISEKRKYKVNLFYKEVCNLRCLLSCIK